MIDYFKSNGLKKGLDPLQTTFNSHLMPRACRKSQSFVGKQT